jgi:hypothetical protein
MREHGMLKQNHIEWGYDRGIAATRGYGLTSFPAGSMMKKKIGENNDH